MNWFKNMKISMKLSLGFATMVLLMGVLALNGYRSAMSIDHLLTETLTQRMPITNLILSADRDLQQMLVAEGSLVFSEVGSETYKSLLKDYQENKEQAKTRWGKAAALFSGQEEIASAKQFESDWATWAPLSAQVLELIQTGHEDDKQRAINLSLGGTAEAFEAMRANIDKVQDLNDKTIVSYQQKAKDLHKQVIISNVVFLIIAVALALAFAFFITGSITGPIRRGVELAEFIAVGDLRQRLRLSQKDEVGQLGAALDKMADSLNDSAEVAETIATGDLSRDIEVASQHDRLGSALRAMLENLRSMVNEIQQSGEQIASGANQVSDSSQALSQGATESASSLEEVSASMQQLTEQVRVNSENASSANQLSGTSKQAAEKGNKQMEQMVAAMEEISQSSQNISRIIKVIDEIAFQTNLLALNAAVEAARAGQHGKGFAVVAEEVRNLAARSAKAAEETTQLIKSSVDLTQNGTSMAQQTSTALKEIREGTVQVADLLEEIAAASQEQAQGIDQINQGLLQIDSVTQQNTASAEESAAAAQELSSQAETLRQMLTRFIIDGRKKTALPDIVQKF